MPQLELYIYSTSLPFASRLSSHTRRRFNRAPRKFDSPPSETTTSQERYFRFTGESTHLDNLIFLYMYHPGILDGPFCNHWMKQAFAPF